MENKEQINCPKCDRLLNLPLCSKKIFFCPDCGAIYRYDREREKLLIAKTKKQYVTQSEDLKVNIPQDNANYENNTYSVEVEKHEEMGFFASLLVSMISFLITLPIFLMFKDNLPEYNWPYHLETRLFFLILLISFYYIVKKVRKGLYVLLFIIVILLVIGTINYEYSFDVFIRDYFNMIYDLL